MTSTAHTRSGWAVWVLWLPGLLVALGAGVATAHGLYEVAAASEVPEVIAWLYPLITDGLALVAYVSTSRLAGSGRRYAWAVVVLAAGLSGLAQASYLAGGVGAAPPLLRFGVGAWPAVAAAIVAHLLFLLGTQSAPDGKPSTTAEPEPVQPTPARTERVQRAEPAEPPPSPKPTEHRPTVQPASVQPKSVQAAASASDAAPSSVEVRRSPSPSVQPQEATSSSRQGESPARDRADRAARTYAAQHDGLPTVTELMTLAEVSRGTAGEALKALRAQPTSLHVVQDQQEAKAQP